ncbi:MAG: hypothetical protein MUC95_04730 [Spirochaetes bacterium]|nr:hypothetical protein [Spirochaetota bacterium]
MFKRARNLSLSGIILLLNVTLSCAGLTNLFKPFEGPAAEKTADESHQICDEYKVWIKGITANDSAGRVYYSFTCKDRIVFLSPYNTLLYSRAGDVIGFQRDGIFHFHIPSKGWGKGVDISGVGLIKNQYEGHDGIPDLTKYSAPPTLVSK